MRPTAGQPTADTTQPEPPRRAVERGFKRRIECDGEGYYAAGAGPARGGGMRDPSIWRERRAQSRG